MHRYAIRTDEGRAGVLLIEPGVTESEIECLANDLCELGRPVVAGFSAHPHGAHLLWHGSVGGADQVRARIDQDRAYAHASRDSHDPGDPRIGRSAEPGWEWVGEVHDGQVGGLARRNERDARAEIVDG